MSFLTEADDELDAADASIKKAIGHMNAVLVNECEGSDDYNREYRSRLVAVQAALLQARIDLARRQR